MADRFDFAKLRELEDLHEAWPDEARDFTPWLARQEWLDALGECIGVEMEMPKKEVKGPQSDRRCDIVAQAKVDGEDERSGTVVIENQLEKTDFSHLGRILLYAATHGAEFVVWVVKDVTQDHKRTVEWLNRNTTAEIGFYLVRVSAYEVGEKSVFPVFTLVEGPDTEEKVEKSGSPRQKRNLLFWTGFTSFVEDAANRAKVSCINSFRQASRDNWYSVSVGTSECHIDLWDSSNRADASLVFGGKAAFDKVKPHLAAMAEAVGVPLDKVSVSADNIHPVIRFAGPCRIAKEAEWPAAYEWFASALAALTPIVRKALGVKD